MLKKILQYIPSFLSLVATVYGRFNPTAECTTRAWVRAPDLAPNTIVQGDARVKISAECPTIDDVSLGLRFKERSFVKALRSREDVTRLSVGLPNHDFLNASPWPSPFVNQSVEEAREELLANKALWIIREEERIVFESTQPFNIGTLDHGILRDAIQEFAVLVPSTNFPPGLERFSAGIFRQQEILDVEWIYEYFVHIAFSNGTVKDVSAGFTAFQPLHDPAGMIQGQSSATVGLQLGMERKATDHLYTANYSIEIRDNSGFAFFAGTNSRVLDAVITRTGFARTFSTPLTISACVMLDMSPKWAVEYGMLDAPPHSRLVRPALHRTWNTDGKMVSRAWRPFCSPQHSPVSVIMPNSSLEEIQASEIVTTTSMRFTIPIKLEEAHISEFETYYETLANALIFTLIAPRAVWTDTDPDDPFSECDTGCRGVQMFEDDEEAWVPWERPPPTITRTYRGRLPITVHPAAEVAPLRGYLPTSTAPLGQAILSDDTSCKHHSLVHYLDDGARAPIFVDRSAIEALLAESPVVRALRTPVLKPVVSSPIEGEERVYRYYTVNPLRWPRYVGETWAKKVAHKNKIDVPADASHGPAPAMQCVKPLDAFLPGV